MVRSEKFKGRWWASQTCAVLAPASIPESWRTLVTGDEQP